MIAFFFALDHPNHPRSPHAHHHPSLVDGVVGKLTPDQKQSLKYMWSEFLALADAAPKQGNGGSAAKLSDKELAGGNSKSPIPWLHSNR